MAKKITLREIISFAETAYGQPCEVICALIIQKLKLLKEQIEKMQKESEKIEHEGEEKDNYYHLGYYQLGIAMTCEKILGKDK